MSAGWPALLLCLSLSGAGAAASDLRPVSRQEIREAMERSTGYDLTATTNGPRFQAEVLRRLVRAAAARDAGQRPLFIGHQEWFLAFLERTGLPEERAPLFMRLAHRYGQDMQVEYRRDRVLSGLTAGPTPELALGICIWWPDTPGAPRSYSYEDDRSTPRVKVTNERLINYRLLEYGDMTVFDRVQGLRGRPTSGVLGLLFRLIGEGHLVENRMALSPEGLQISRARARKAFWEVVSTVTVYPDGRAEKDVPPGRPDLAALDKLLRSSRAARYHPLECPGGR